MSAAALDTKQLRFSRHVSRSRRRSRSGMHNIMANQLTLLRGQATAAVSFDLANRNAVIGELANGKLSTGTGDVIDALRRIVVNTYATSVNTANLITDTGGAIKLIGTHAAGGWITGGIPNMDSVRLASGDLGMPGEFVIRKEIAQRDAAWLPDYNRTGALPHESNNVIPFSPRAADDGGRPLLPAVTARNGNSEVVAELRALRSTVEKQGKELKELHTKIAEKTSYQRGKLAEYLGEKFEEVVGTAGKEVAREIRFNERKNRL